MAPLELPAVGGCVCGRARYRLLRAPMFVHCCHCSWCRRESGSAFALNALIEADQVELLDGATETIDTPSSSGRGQRIVRCTTCRLALWSHYAAAGEAISFVRVGTLADAHALSPDIHIFTSSRLPWVELPEATPAVEAYYRRSEHWPAESVERYRKAIGR